MLFSYALYFLAVISGISVLAAPLPADDAADAAERKPSPLFDFGEYVRTRTAANIISGPGKKMTKGDWLRRVHPDNLVWIISNRICTHLTYCRWNTVFRRR